MKVTNFKHFIENHLNPDQVQPFITLELSRIREEITYHSSIVDKLNEEYKILLGMLK